MSAPAIRVDGIKDLVRELRQVNRELPKEMRVTHREVAGIILRAAKARAEALGGIFARAARGVFAGGDNRDAFIRLRPSNRNPVVFGGEFGAAHNVLRWVRGRARSVAVGPATPGGVFRRRGWNQLPTWGGNQFMGGAGGYFVFPSIRAEGTRVVQEYEQRVLKLLARAFPD